VSERILLPSLLLLLLTLGLPGLTSAADGLSDPTRPPQTLSASRSDEHPPAMPRWELQAILIGEERRVAVINVRPLTERGRLEGATVLRIAADKVLLRYQGTLVTLKLPQLDGAGKRMLKPEGKLKP
jgi:hypothetical protein